MYKLALLSDEWYMKATVLFRVVAIQRCTCSVMALITCVFLKPQFCRHHEVSDYPSSIFLRLGNLRLYSFRLCHSCLPYVSLSLPLPFTLFPLPIHRFNYAPQVQQRTFFLHTPLAWTCRSNFYRLVKLWCCGRLAHVSVISFLGKRNNHETGQRNGCYPVKWQGDGDRRHLTSAASRESWWRISLILPQKVTTQR